MTSYNLGFPSNLDHGDVTAFIRSLRPSRSGRGLTRSDPVVFELAATPGSVRWNLSADPADSDRVRAALRAHLPNVRITKTQPPATPGGCRFGFEVRLSDQGSTLRTDLAEEVAAGLLAEFDDLRSNETVRIQWLLGPLLPRRVAKPTPSTRQRVGIDRILAGPAMDAEAARRRNDKQREPVFAVLGRVAVSAATTGRARHLAKAVFAAMGVLNEPGVQLLRRTMSSTRVLRRMDSQQVPRIEWPCALNAAELASLLAWPVGGPVAASVSYSGRRELPFPPSVLTPQPSTSTSRLRVLGRASYPGRDGLVTMTAADAVQHLHVAGPTGVGKSTLLANLISQDIAAGRGVVVIEPKGDLIADVTDRIPPDRVNHVAVLDPADVTHPVGLDILNAPAQSVEVTVDAVVHLFRSLFSSSWGPRTQDILHACLLTLARTPEMTLAELPVLLTDPGFRTRHTRDSHDGLGLGGFWGWFNSLSEAEKGQVIAPVLNKVRAFTMRTGVRRIIGQTNPPLSMTDVFTKQRIVLVPLKAGEIGPQTASLLGGLVIAQLWQAAQQQSAIDASHRRPVMLYLDEFQNYLHLPTELDDVLAQARGLGLGMTLAHQHLAQLVRPEMRAAVLMNARSRLVFQTGSQDATQLAKTLGGGLEPTDLTALGRWEAYAQLMADHTSHPPGSLTTLPLVDALGSRAAVIEASRNRFGRPAAEIDAAMIERQRSGDGDAKTGGRRRRNP